MAAVVRAVACDLEHRWQAFKRLEIGDHRRTLSTSQGPDIGLTASVSVVAGRPVASATYSLSTGSRGICGIGRLTILVLAPSSGRISLLSAPLELCKQHNSAFHFF